MGQANRTVGVGRERHVGQGEDIGEHVGITRRLSGVDGGVEPAAKLIGLVGQAEHHRRGGAEVCTLRRFCGDRGQCVQHRESMSVEIAGACSDAEPTPLQTGERSLIEVSVGLRRVDHGLEQVVAARIAAGEQPLSGIDREGAPRTRSPTCRLERFHRAQQHSGPGQVVAALGVTCCGAQGGVDRHGRIDTRRHERECGTARFTTCAVGRREVDVQQSRGERSPCIVPEIIEFGGADIRTREVDESVGRIDAHQSGAGCVEGGGCRPGHDFIEHVDQRRFAEESQGREHHRQIFDVVSDHRPDVDRQLRHIDRHRRLDVRKRCGELCDRPGQHPSDRR